MTAVALHGDLQAALHDARTMTAKMNSLHANGDVQNHQLDVATNAVCLAAHVAFERFVRDLFFECVTDTSGLTNVRSLIGNLDSEAVSGIVLGGRQYVDWLPIPRTIERSHSFLRLGQPFVRLWRRTLVLDQLHRLHIVRNRIAHSGEKAEADYAKQIARGQAAFAEPARWLRYTTAGATKTNLELIFDAMSDAGDALVATNRTPIGLGPARVESNERVAPGKYKCEHCSRTVHASAWETLGPCPRCTSTPAPCPHCGHQRQARTTWILDRLKAG